MKNSDDRRAAVVRFATATLISLLTCDPLRAQQSTPPPPPPPKRTSPSNQPVLTPPPTRSVESINQRALDLEMLSTVGRRDRNDESISKRVAAQLIEDFDRLSQINAEAITPLLAVESVDYKKLSQATSEIKHRATRIKYTISLPLENKKSEKVRYEADVAKLRSMLPELDRVMKSFLENPVFRISSPNDTELRSAAARDLEAIINLSETINKVAKPLSKSVTSNK